MLGFINFLILFDQGFRLKIRKKGIFEDKLVFHFERLKLGHRVAKLPFCLSFGVFQFWKRHGLFFFCVLDKLSGFWRGIKVCQLIFEEGVGFVCAEFKACSFELLIVVGLLDECRQFRKLFVWISINDSEGLNFMVNFGSTRFSDIGMRGYLPLNFFGKWIQSKKIQNCDQDAFSHQHITIRVVWFFHNHLKLLTLNQVHCVQVRVSVLIFNLIKFSPTKVSTFNGVWMNYAEKFMHIHSAASLFWVRIVFVLCFHLFLGIDWLKILEIRTVEFNQLAEKLSLCLKWYFVQTVTINKKVLCWRMRMKVKVKKDVFILFKPYCISLDSPYRWAFI